MSGEWLAMGAVAALVAAAGRPGSRNETFTGLIVNHAGFPWPRHYTVYHATTGLRSILRHGFRVRSEGLAAATGGGTDEAVSFTLDLRVARSILIGLRTLRAGALGSMKLVELYDRFGAECPGAIRVYEEWRTRDSSFLGREELERLDGGWLKVEKGLGGVLPQGAIPIGNGWMGRDHRYYVAWWKKPTTKEERSRSKAVRIEAFKSLYTALLATGSDARCCTDPVFWGTDMGALAKMKLEDLGLIEARIDIPRVCLGPMDAIQAGYLTESVARYWQQLLSRWARDCRSPLEKYGRRRGYDGNFLYSVPTDGMMGPFRIVDSGEVNPSTTMAYLASMAELRVYDVTRITIDASETASRHLAAHDSRMADGLTHPWFNGAELNREGPGASVILSQQY